MRRVRRPWAVLTAALLFTDACSHGSGGHAVPSRSTDKAPGSSSSRPSSLNPLGTASAGEVSAASPRQLYAYESELLLQHSYRARFTLKSTGALIADGRYQDQADASVVLPAGTRLVTYEAITYLRAPAVFWTKLGTTVHRGGFTQHQVGELASRYVRVSVAGPALRALSIPSDELTLAADIVPRSFQGAVAKRDGTAGGVRAVVLSYGPVTLAVAADTGIPLVVTTPSGTIRISGWDTTQAADPPGPNDFLDGSALGV